MTVRRKNARPGHRDRLRGTGQELRELEAQGREIIHLEIGEPDFDTPRSISSKPASMAAMQPRVTPTMGPRPDCQSSGKPSPATAGRCAAWTNTRHPENVVVTPGAKPIMFYVMLALGEPRVEIIYPNPGFPIYESMVKFSGCDTGTDAVARRVQGLPPGPGRPGHRKMSDRQPGSSS